MRLLIFTCFLGLLLLGSCEEPFELSVDLPQIVINTRVQAGQTPSVTVRVVDGPGNTLTSEELQRSLVTINQEEGEEIEFELGAFSDSSATFHSSHLIEAGKRYTLLIKTPGFADLRSITEVPENLPVRTQSTGATGPNGGLLPKDDIFHLPLSFDDPKDVNNYFHIVVTVRDADTDVEAVEPDVVNFGLFPRPSDAQRYEETGWIFSDDDFTNSVFKSEILVSKELVIQYPKPVVTVELRSLSVDYFNFYVWSSQPKSGNFPTLGQHGATDNIAGGIGLFGGYSSSRSSYVLEY